MHKTRLFILGLVAIAVACGGLVWFFTQEKKTEDSLGSDFPAVAGELREMKGYWQTVITQAGPEEAYAQFLQKAPHSTIPAHSLAHAFGEALYEVEGIEGLRYCDSSFEFGCYHSFFGVAVNAEGIETLPRFDDACRDKFGDKNLPCQHGIGHGLLVYTDYDNLIKALELCETISQLPTGGCSSGVFMEYNFHTMDDSSDFIREAGENLYEPCDTLPQRFQASCYFEQVQWWQSVVQRDYKRIGELCAKLPQNSAEYRACYNGSGNYIAADAKFDVDQIIAWCALMPNDESRGLCHEGASWLVRGEKDGETVAAQLCEVLQEPYKAQCFQKLQ